VHMAHHDQPAGRVEGESAATGKALEASRVDREPLVGAQLVDAAPVFLAEEELPTGWVDGQAAQGGRAGVGERDADARLVSEVHRQLAVEVDPVDIPCRIAM